jgi:hypothetical protein
LGGHFFEVSDDFIEVQVELDLIPLSEGVLDVL